MGVSASQADQVSEGEVVHGFDARLFLSSGEEQRESKKLGMQKVVGLSFLYAELICALFSTVGSLTHIPFLKFIFQIELGFIMQLDFSIIVNPVSKLPIINMGFLD